MSLEYIATSQVWNGEAINGVRHPPNIEFLWSDVALAAIGLRKQAPILPPLAEAKAAKIAQAWVEQTIRFADAAVEVLVAGELRPYGCDPVTRENIVAIVGAITAVPEAIPNPRPFTPKGSSIPVATTHDEFKAIYLAGLAKGDEFYAAYFAHKAAISALTTSTAVENHNLAAGWPA